MTAVDTDKSLLSILNDDCVYKILEWLPFDDLCSFSRTCKHLQVLSNNHFRRKFPKESNQRVRIEYDGNLQCAKYVVYFSNPIKKLDIVVYSEENCPKIQDSIVGFVKAKCNANLRQINIVGKMELVNFGKEIENFLQNVEVVRFGGAVQDDEDKSMFLKYCPNLTTIAIYDWLPQKRFDEILEQTYPKLTHFHWSELLDDNLELNNSGKLETFFLQNRNIQYLSIDIVRNSIDTKAMPACLSTVVDFACNLKHLCISVEGKFGKQFKQILKHLQVLRKRSNFQSLHLSICEYSGNRLAAHLNQLANFKQLTRISLNNCRIKFINLAKVLEQLGHLKSIFVFNSMKPEDWSTVDELVALADETPSITLPQIEEVTIYCKVKELLTFVMRVARHWVNVKQISVHKEQPEEHLTFPIAELNRARMKLKNASELTIFTDDDTNITKLDHQLVKLKRCNFEYDDFCLNDYGYEFGGIY